MTLYSSFTIPLVFGSLLWIIYAIFLIFAGLAARPKAGTTEWIHRAAHPAAFDVNTAALAKRTDPVLALIVLVVAILLRALPFCLTGPIAWQSLSNSLPHCLTAAIGSAVAWLGACRLTGSRLSGLLSAFFAFCLLCLSNAQDYGTMLAFLFLLPACSHTWLLPVAGLLMGLATWIADTSALCLLFPALVIAVLSALSRRRCLPLLLWLATAALAFAVAIGLQFITANSICCPLPSWNPYRFALPFYAPAVLSALWLIVRLYQQARFPDILLFTLLISCLTTSFFSCSAFLLLPALVAAEAWQLIYQRGRKLSRICPMLFALLLLYATAEALLPGLVP